MSATAKLQALLATEHFVGRTEAELADMAVAAAEAFFAPGAVLVREGQRGGSPSYLILSGEATVEADLDGQGARRVGPGTLVGVLAADPHLQSNTVTALTLMHLLALDAPTATAVSRHLADMETEL
ncbi:MAG: hypothetical protein QOI61_99 [Actinomycetota bacterium]|jgi:hypothetical protein